MEDQADYIADTVSMMGRGYEVDAPPAEIFGIASGYTPTPDVLCKKYGFVTALVWGRMWRYCQGRDRVCRAKLELIASGLGMSERTVIRHIETLVDGKYFEDKTPNLKNRPHVYADTGKLRLAFSTEIVESGVTESQRAMTESQRQVDRESVEDSNKREEKNIHKDPIILKMASLGWQPTASTLDFLNLWKEIHPEEKILLALDKSRGKSMKYADTILRGWEKDGYPETREQRIKSNVAKPQTKQAPAAGFMLNGVYITD